MSKKRRPKKKVSHPLRSYATGGPVTGPAPRIMGVDHARPGSDKTAIARVDHVQSSRALEPQPTNMQIQIINVADSFEQLGETMRAMSSQVAAALRVSPDMLGGNRRSTRMSDRLPVSPRASSAPAMPPDPPKRAAPVNPPLQPGAPAPGRRRINLDE